MERRFFWNDGDPQVGVDRTRMYVEGNLVALEVEYRYNHHVIRFPVADYGRVWQQLRQGKGGEVVGENGNRLWFRRKGNQIELTLVGPSTPGSVRISDSVGLRVELNQLALTEEELVSPDEPLAEVFNTLKALVAAGKIEPAEIRSVTAGLNPEQLNELIELFQDMEMLREAAGQAEAGQWKDAAQADRVFSGRGLPDSMVDYYDGEVRSVSRGSQDATRRIGTINAVLRDMYRSRVSDPGPEVFDSHHLKIHCRPGIVEVVVTFIGIGDCCWRSGKRVFRVQPAGDAFSWELVDYEDEIAEMISPIDDEHDRCFGDHTSEFTRTCGTWLRDNTAILRQNIGS